MSTDATTKPNESFGLGKNSMKNHIESTTAPVDNSLLELDHQLKDVRNSFLSALQEFDAFNKTFEDHDIKINNFKNKTIVLEKELGLARDHCSLLQRDRIALEKSVSILEEKIENEFVHEDILYSSIHLAGEENLKLRDTINGVDQITGSIFSTLIKLQERMKSTDSLHSIFLSEKTLIVDTAKEIFCNTKVRNDKVSQMIALKDLFHQLLFELRKNLEIEKDQHNAEEFACTQFWNLKSAEIFCQYQQSLKDIHEQNSDIQERLSQAATNLSEERKRNQGHQDDILELNRENSEIKETLDIISASHEELVEEIEHKKSKLSKAEKRIMNLESKCSEKDAMLLELSKELEAMSDTFSDDKRKDEQKISDLKESLRKSNLKLVMESASSDSIAKEVFSLQQIVDEKNEEIQSFTKKLTFYERENSLLKEKMDLIEDDAKAKARTIDVLESSGEEMKVELDDLKKKNKDLLVKVHEANLSEEGSREKFMNYELENKALKEELRELHSLCKSLKEKNEQLDKSTSFLRKDLSSMNSYSNELEQKNVVVEVEKKKLQDQIEKLKHQQKGVVGTNDENNKAGIQISKLKSLLRVKDSQLMELAEELQTVSDMHMNEKDDNDKKIANLQQSLLNANYVSMELNAELEYIKNLYSKEKEAHHATKHKLNFNFNSYDQAPSRSITPISNESDEKRNESTLSASARVEHGSSSFRSIPVVKGSPLKSNSFDSSWAGKRGCSALKNYKVGLYSTDLDTLSQAPNDVIEREVEIMFMG